MENTYKNVKDLLSAARTLVEMAEDIEGKEVSGALLQTVQGLTDRIHCMLAALQSGRTIT